MEEQETKQKIFNTVEVMILHYLKENKSINIEEAAKLTQLEGIDIRNILNELVEGGYLERNNRKFIFTQRVYGSFGEDVGYIKDKTVDYIKAKTMILEYIEQKGSITNKTVQDLCCYDERKVRYILSKMKEDGIISLIAAGSNSYYVRTDNKPTINRQFNNQVKKWLPLRYIHFFTKFPGDCELLVNSICGARRKWDI
ncbi:hypothetical protein [Clostridium sp.]|uniref:hypothetical protein n=1 Tax=Clostridium sp. TaxID=1506 RepID=UPI003D6D7AF3